MKSPSEEFDELLAKMQTPESRAAVRNLFKSTPQELGEAAVRAARGSYLESSALIDGDYRYRLWRRWKPEGLRACFIMLNPDGTQDDPTIRRCVGFAKQLGAASLDVVNLFAYRATDPKMLRKVKDPVGPGNDEYIQAVTDAATWIIAAWGANGTLLGRDRQVLKLLAGKNVQALGVTKSGAPGHPLYLKATSVLNPYP